MTETLGCVLKDADDIKRFRAEVAKAGLTPVPATSRASAASRAISSRRRSALRGAAARARGCPITPRAGHRRRRARSITSTSATARSSSSGLRAVFVARPEEVADLRPLLRGVLAGRTRGRRGRRGAAGAAVARGRRRRALDESGPAARALALEGWGEEEAEDAASRSSVPAASEAGGAGRAATSRPSAPISSTRCYRLTVQIARRLARRMSRRRRPRAAAGPGRPAAHAAREPDARRAHRAALPAAQARKVRLVLLCDVSGSMDLYSRFLLQFLFALQNVFAPGGDVHVLDAAHARHRAPARRARTAQVLAPAAGACATGRAAPASASRWPSSTASGRTWWTAARS